MCQKEGHFSFYENRKTIWENYGGMYFMTEEYLPSVKRLDNDKAHQLLLKPELVKSQ